MEIINYCDHQSYWCPKQRVMCGRQTGVKGLRMALNDVIAPRALGRLILGRTATASACVVRKLLFLIKCTHCALTAFIYASCVP